MLKAWLKSALSHAHIGQAELSRQLTTEVGRNIDRAAVNKMVKGGREIAADELLAIRSGRNSLSHVQARTRYISDVEPGF